MIQAVRSKKEVYAVALILAAVLLSYFNALSNGFVYDDVAMVQVNPIIRGWSNVPAIFTTGYWTPTGTTSGGLYRPLTILSYLLEYSIGGINPAIYHLDNILLHFLCSVLVYLVVRKITDNESGSVAAALLFAVHPVHVEAVANVSGRSEILASLFTMAALFTFISPPRRVPWYAVSPFLLLIGLLAKENAVVLPLLVLAYILVFERDGRGKDLKRVAVSITPYALVIAVFLVIRFFVLADEIYPQGKSQVLVHTKDYWRMLVMFKVFVNYVKLSVFPADLYSHYMLRPPDSFFDPWVFLFIGIVGSFAALSPWLIRHNRAYFFFGIWFFIALLPVSNIIPIGILMAERSLYLPSVSVCAAGGLLFSWVAGDPTIIRHRPAAAFSILLAILVGFGFLTHERNNVWHDAVSLDNDLVRSYTKIINDFPESGLYYYHMFKTVKFLDRKDDALAAINKAVELEPSVVVYRTDLAKYYLEAGNYELALAEVQKALSITTDLLPEIYAMFAEVFYRNGMTAEKERCIKVALSADPVNSHVAVAEIASHLYNMGMLTDAERYLKRAIELNPYMPKYHLHYSDLLIKKGMGKESLEEFTKAEALEPVAPGAYFAHGLLLAKHGEYLMAVKQLEKAAALNPTDPSVHYYLAAACIGADLDEQAVTELEEALRLKPDYIEARQLLDQR